MPDLLTLITQDTILKRVAATHGGEYVAPCPWCGGADRFHVWPQQGRWAVLSNEAAPPPFPWTPSGPRSLVPRRHFINGNGANALRIATLEDLLRLRQRINQYLDTQQADSPLPEVNQIAQAEMIDTLGAIKLAEALGYGTIPQQTLRSACDAGNIEGAHKRSRSGRAQTKRGGRWEFPRDSFIEWLQDRHGAPPVDLDQAQSSLQGNFPFV